MPYPALVSPSVQLPTEEMHHTIPGKSNNPTWPRDEKHLVVIPSSRLDITLPRPVIGVLASVSPRGLMLTTKGLRRVKVTEIVSEDPLLVEIDELPPRESTAYDLRRLARVRARVRKRDYVELSPGLLLEGDLTPTDQLDCYAIALEVNEVSKLALLDTIDWPDRIKLIQALLGRRDRSGRRYRTRDEPEDEDNSKLPKHVEDVISSISPARGSRGTEVISIIRDLKWVAPPAPEIDLAWARQRLDDSHAGLEQVKTALLDHLSLMEWRRRQDVVGRGTSLCLVGPPGVGKTSIAATIAEVTGRQLEVLPMGGMTDLDVVGANSTFNSARPSELVRRLRRTKRHPSELVCLLDEVDKIGNRNDHTPLPVLLALLDPSQNSRFQDRYLSDITLDLSGVFWIATANERSDIPGPLQDRLEMIQLPGYSQAEQIRIAQDKLLPRLLEQLGVHDEVSVSPEAITSLVLEHPKTPGCRQLEQRLETILARALRQHLEQGGQVLVTAELAQKWLPPKSEGRQLGFSVG